MFKWRQYAAREMWKQNVQQEENDIEGEGGSFTSLMTAILTAECLIRYPTTRCIRKHSEKERLCWINRTFAELKDQITYLPDNADRSVAKQKFKITNWPTYNKALINRGSITFWLDDEAIQAGMSQQHLLHEADLSAILTLPSRLCWSLNAYSGWPCAAQGFIDSIFLWWTFRYAARITAVSAGGQSRLMSVSKRPPGVKSHTGNWFHRAEGLRWRRVESQKHGRERRRIWRKLHPPLTVKHMKSSALTCRWTTLRTQRPSRVNPANPPENQVSRRRWRLRYPALSRWTAA